MGLPPGPRLPAAVQTAAYALRPFETLDACVARYGDLFTLKLVTFGTMVCASRPETIKQIFTGDPRTMKVGEANAGLRPLIGEHSILLLDGEPHFRHRRLAAPFFFHGEGPAAQAGAMCEVAARTIAAWPEGRPLPMHEHMRVLTLDIVLRVLFGAEGDELMGLRHALARVTSRGASPFDALLLVPALQRDLGPVTPWASLTRDLAAADALIYRHIRDARARGRAGRGVLAALLAAAEDDGTPLHDVEARDTLVTLIIAGHETTSTTLCWALEAILTHPEVARRLDAELASVAGKGPLDPSHLAALEYLDATIKEVLRLYPVVPILGMGRLLTEPLEVQGHLLPAGVKLVPTIYATHQRPDLYPDPKRFLPDRFLGIKPDPYAFLPFGGGVRRCLGMGFALQELKVVLGTLLLDRRLTLERKGPATAHVGGVTVAPLGGTWVRVASRRERGSA
ncbi:MAG: cytochrome P450 [Byssovorax sp.]